MTKLNRLAILALVAAFLLGILSIFATTVDFQKNQLKRSESADQNLTSITVVWPRLISKSNDLQNFEKDLNASGDWKIDSSFLLFREMTDSKGTPFYLVGSSNFQDYFATTSNSIPKTCVESKCEVLAAIPNGAKTPQPTSLGFTIIGVSKKALTLPIPRDFGLDSQIPLLITPQVSDLARYEPTKYLLASYGWRLTPKTLDGLSAPEFKARIAQLTSALTMKYENVAINFDKNEVDTLITNQEHIDQHRTEGLKLLVFLFLILSALLLSGVVRINGGTSLTLALSAIFAIQFLWNFRILVQVSIFLLLSYLLIRIVGQLQDKRLVKNDLGSLVLLRSSVRFITSLSLSLSLAIAILLSSTQYFNRNESLKADQITSQVPLDFTLKVGSSLDKPLDLGSLNEIESLASGTKATPLIRSSATLSDSQGTSTEVNLLAIQESKPWQEPSIHLPPARSIKFFTRGIPKEIQLVIWFRNANGAHFSAISKGSGIRSIELTSSQMPTAIVAFELRETPENATLRQHALGESSARTFNVLNGTAAITKIEIDGQPIAFDDTWKTSYFGFSLQNGPVIIRPESTTRLGEVKVSSDLLLLDTELSINGLGTSPLTLSTVAKVPNYDGVEAPFAVLDLAPYQAITALQEPGAIDPIEIWIKSSSPRDFLKSFASSKFRTLALISRESLETRQDSSPYQQTWQKLFVASSLFALVLVSICIAYFIICISRIRRIKVNELTQEFQESPPSLTPIIVMISAAFLSSVPFLYLARYLARLLT